jgi:hypothetical protein
MALPIFVSSPAGWWSSPYSDVSEISISVTRDDLPYRSERVLVSSLPSTNYYLPTNLVYYNDPIIYSSPYYSSISYLDINGDKDLQKKMTRYFFSQLYNEYIPSSHSDLLDYVKLNPRDIELVKSIKQASSNSTKKSDFAEKITYLAENIFTKDDIYKVLTNYVNNNDVNWWDLKRSSNNVERILVKKLEEKIKDMIE